METVVIDVLRTPEIQRLRRIRQIGLGYLVFPGAEHSRLVHSLGASYLAIRFGRQLVETTRDFLVESLRPNPSSIRDLAVAALCHDLGHGPLSHAWEREIVGEDYNFDKWIKKLGLDEEKEYLRGAKWHELVGHAFLAWEDGTLHKLLERHEDGFSKRLRYLLRGKYFIPYLPRLLCSDIDIDRADFLKRDAHFCGVTYGKYDLDRLLSTCAIGTTSSNELVVGFDEKKSIRVVEQFLIARRALYETVYYHKTVHSAEGMVALFLRRLKEIVHDGKELQVAEFVRPILKMISGDVVGPEELLALDDFSLWVFIENITKNNKMDYTVQDLGQRILSRDLFKMVPCSPEKINEFLRKPDGHLQMYNAIQPYCPGKEEFYMFIDTVKFKMFSENDCEMGYFIGDLHKATPIREHEELKPYWLRNEVEFTRLFTINEAVDSLKKLIG
ncbi:MAG: HD domain-containing protein [Candidatus Scalindua sp.]